MLTKKNKLNHKSQIQNTDDSMTGTIGIKSRQIMTFVTDKQQAETTRSLDDFHRTDGFQPFTLRQLGVTQLSKPSAPIPEVLPHLRARWFCRHKKRHNG